MSLNIHSFIHKLKTFPFLPLIVDLIIDLNLNDKTISVIKMYIPAQRKVEGRLRQCHDCFHGLTGKMS